MIPYETLVQTIADWKAGARPAGLSVPPPIPAAATAEVELVEEYATEDVQYADPDQDYGQEHAGQEYAGQEYAGQEYAGQEYAEQPSYEDDEY